MESTASKATAWVVFQGTEQQAGGGCRSFMPGDQYPDLSNNDQIRMLDRRWREVLAAATGLAGASQISDWKKAQRHPLNAHGH